MSNNSLDEAASETLLRLAAVIAVTVRLRICPPLALLAESWLGCWKVNASVWVWPPTCWTRSSFGPTLHVNNLSARENLWTFRFCLPKLQLFLLNYKYVCYLSSYFKLPELVNNGCSYVKLQPTNGRWPTYTVSYNLAHLDIIMILFQWDSDCLARGPNHK